MTLTQISTQPPRNKACQLFGGTRTFGAGTRVVEEILLKMSLVTILPPPIRLLITKAVRAERRESQLSSVELSWFSFIKLRRRNYSD